MKLALLAGIIGLVIGIVFRRKFEKIRGGYELHDPGEPDYVNNHGPVLLFVKIPESITPEERTERYEDPLNEFLVSQKLGAVTGGGSQLNEEREIESVGLDVEVYEPERVIPVIIRILRELGVPQGTVIEQYEPMERTIRVR
jgi:hypothetical protein